MAIRARAYPLIFNCKKCGKQNTVVSEGGNDVGYFIPISILEEFETGNFSIILKILSRFERGIIRKVYVCKKCGALFDIYEKGHE